jgi:hypothetical protein
MGFTTRAIPTILHARMRGGLLNKARRGALALRLPVGYRRLGDGSVVQDPDEQVRTSLRTIFEQFSLLQRARAVQRYFKTHDLQVPRYVQDGPDRGRLFWVTPTYQMIQQVLTNPAYAGLFVFGRRIQQTRPGLPPEVHSHRRPIEDWDIVVPDVYPPYISRAQYEANRETLRTNMYNFVKKQRGAPREGPGLLTGIVVCGKCGRRMTVSYGKSHHAYWCRREQLTEHAAQCQSFPVQHLDAAIRDLFFTAVQPARLDTILAALDVLEEERRALDHQWQLKLERARYAARLAQRQYDAVDPDNRLVAHELETRWNDALGALHDLERAYARARRTELAPLTETEQQAVRQLADDLPTVWEAPTTLMADRKQLVRLVVQEVHVLVTDPTSPRTAEVTILWAGGATTTHTVVCPKAGWHCLTDPAIIERIRTFAQTYPDYQIADRLNADGIRTQTGKLWSHQRVASLRKEYQIPTACPVDPTTHPRRGDGFVSASYAAQQLGVSPSLINLWIKQGVLTSKQRVVQSYQWVRLTDEDQDRLDGKHDWSIFPTVREVARERAWSHEEVWSAVRAGDYLAYRHRSGQSWQWRLHPRTVETTERFA